MVEKLRTKAGHFLFREEGGKKVLNRKNAGLLAAFLASLGLVGLTLPTILKGEDSSELKTSDLPVVENGTVNAMTPESSTKYDSIGGVTGGVPPKLRAKSAGRVVSIRYKAKQVIGPAEGTDKIPTGTNFIGKLISSIDTRAPQTVQVILPYGASHKSGGSIPKETILFGKVNYSGQGERVYLMFDRGVLPDGQEIAIQAQALSSKDYRAGLIGDFHSNTANRMASVMGLSMVSGISEVMVEKEALGQTYMPTAKANLKNGFYNGLAKVTETEAGIQAEKLAQSPEYVTVEAGVDLIVSLVASYGQSER